MMRPREAFTSAPLDRVSVSQIDLNVSEHLRTNPLPWIGQFSPQFAENILAAYAPRGAIVLDPFAGSGTVLIEAAKHGLTAYGADINPAAVILSRVYELVNLGIEERYTLITDLRRRVVDTIGLPAVPLLPWSKPMDRRELENSLVSWGWAVVAIQRS